jgi:prepilin-type N-terminal cleavage/methylation domain-containing protein
MRKNAAFRPARRDQTGFTLIEMLVTVSVLVVVLGIVFSYVGRLQRVYKTEETKVDAAQETRTFFDSLQREIHQAGFPGHNMYGPNILNLPVANDQRNAVGLVKVSNAELWFEADIDNDGQVESVRYSLRDSAGNPVTAASTCPCSLWRSQVRKADGVAPMLQNTNYALAVDNVINSGGIGAGGAALVITGNTAPSSGNLVANDVLYSGYKTPPVFSAFDQSGNVIVLPVDINANPSTLAQVRTIAVNINVLTVAVDARMNMRPALSMHTSVKLNNY